MVFRAAAGGECRTAAKQRAVHDAAICAWKQRKRRRCMKSMARACELHSMDDRCDARRRDETRAHGEPPSGCTLVICSPSHLAARSSCRTADAVGASSYLSVTSAGRRRRDNSSTTRVDSSRPRSTCSRLDATRAVGQFLRRAARRLRVAQRSMGRWSSTAVVELTTQRSSRRHVTTQRAPLSQLDCDSLQAASVRRGRGRRCNSQVGFRAGIRSYVVGG